MYSFQKQSAPNQGFTGFVYKPDSLDTLSESKASAAFGKHTLGTLHSTLDYQIYNLGGGIPNKKQAETNEHQTA